MLRSKFFFPARRFELLLDAFLLSGDATSEDSRVWTEKNYRTSKRSSRRSSFSFRKPEREQLSAMIQQILVNSS